MRLASQLWFGRRLHRSTLTYFKRFGSGAVALLRELLRLDWKTRINAVDAMDHPYFKMQPLPLHPHEIPMYEESHELDRRKFHDRKANLPPAPKGGTVGLGPDANGATAGFNSSDGYGSRNGANGGRYRGPPPEARKGPWPRDRGPPPPGRQPQGDTAPPQDHADHRDRERGGARNRGGPRGGGGDIDTYIPSYGRDGPAQRREDRPMEDRRRRDGKEDRRLDRDRRTDSRSKSPTHDRRDRDRERDTYRR